MKLSRTEPPLPPNRGKDFWSVVDCFNEQRRSVACFIHRHYEIGMHGHEFIEVNVVLRGRGRHDLEETSFATAPGDVFVIPPRARHGYAQQRPLDVYHLLLHPQFIRAHQTELRTLPGYLLFFSVEPFYRAETRFRYGLKLAPGVHRRVVGLLDLIRQEVAEEGAQQDQVVEPLTLGFIALLCRAYAAQHAAAREDRGFHPNTRAMRAVIELVAARYGEKLTLDDLACAARIQKNYFCRIFRRITGVTPMDYVTQYRLNVARRLLRESRLTITQIAYETGFYDSAHFSRQFARAFGTPPSRLRLASE